MQKNADNFSNTLTKIIPLNAGLARTLIAAWLTPHSVNRVSPLSVGSAAGGAFISGNDIMPKLKDRTPKAGGRSAAFQLRIHPELHAQLRELTANENVTLACWLKDLARRELRRRGIEPKG